MPGNDKTNPLREDRIRMQIVVDAYGPDERAMGWYCYLENTLTFPFVARVIGRPKPATSGRVENRPF